MKRILVISDMFYPENFLINDLVKQWERDGLHIEVVTQWPSYPEGKVYEGYANLNYKQEKWDNIIIHRFKAVEGYKDSKVRKILNYAAYVFWGRKIVDRIGSNFDSIFVHQVGPLTQALLGVHISKRYNIPLTVWTLDVWPDAIYAYGFPKIKLISYFIDLIIKKVYLNCNKIFVSSYKFSETIKEYAPDKDIVYVPNWLLPVKQASSSLRLDPNKFHFTFTGNISIFQNLKNVILGFHEANIDKVQLNIVGDGSALESLQNIVENKEIKNVVFHGRQPYNEMQDVMLQSNVLVLPLIADSGIEKTEPFKLQSYLQVGKPVFAVARGATQDIVEGEGLGYCASPLDIFSIADGFKYFMQLSLEEQNEINASAKRLRDSRYNREVIIKRIYDEIVFKADE